VQKNSAEYDLQFLAAGLEELENYLLTTDIYRVLSIRAPFGQKAYPPFTLGWMLLSRIRAQIRAETPTQHTQFEQISSDIDFTKTNWRSAWGRKAAVEFSARLNLWRDFLMEFRKNPEGNIDRYDYEVNRRVLLELLQSEMDQNNDAELDALSSLDLMLRAIFENGEFILDDDMKIAFSRPEYWYLYGKPKLNFS
jgi:hypothetical protein